MFKSMWKELPTSFKVFWFGSLIVGLGVTGFVLWAIWRVVMHVTGG